MKFEKEVRDNQYPLNLQPIILKKAQFLYMLERIVNDMLTWIDNGYVFRSILGHHKYGDRIDADDDRFQPRNAIGEWDLWRFPDGSLFLVFAIWPALMLPLMMCL